MDEEPVAVLLDRTSRATRGKRMTKLLDEEYEADEEFWNQDAFKEIAEDVEYEAEEEVVDEFDSDFDEDETMLDDDEPPPEEDERVKRKKLLPPGSKPVKTNKKKSSTPKTKGLDVIEAAVAAAMQAEADEPAVSEISQKETQEIPDSTEGAELECEKIVRKSTRTAVIVRQAEREALRAAMQATTIKPAKKKREGEKRITQEDMLLEAAQTEILNRQNLEKMLAREEEVKQKAIVHKTIYSGPQIRFLSRDGKNFLEFIGDGESGDLFSQEKPRPKQQLRCVITGLPAKYVDPLTGLPYATKEAFKIIRARLTKEEYSQSKATPGKKERSPRFCVGRPTVKKSRRSMLNSVSRSDLFGPDASIDIHGDALCAETSAATDPGIQNMARDPIPISMPRLYNAPMDEMEHLELSKPRSRIGSVGSMTENVNTRLWVEIPQPREEPSEDGFILDDLTSLDFGPILNQQHGFASDLQKQDDVEIDDPSYVGAYAPVDALQITSDFTANVML